MLLAAWGLLLLPRTLAWIWIIRKRNSNQAEGTEPNLAVLLMILLVMLLTLSLGVQQRVATGDGSAYSFHARIFASGRIVVDAPPRTSIGEKQYLWEFRCHHQIISGDKWFARFSPGWPAILAVKDLLRIGWLVNPLFDS